MFEEVTGWLVISWVPWCKGWLNLNDGRCYPIHPSNHPFVLLTILLPDFLSIILPFLSHSSICPSACPPIFTFLPINPAIFVFHFSIHCSRDPLIFGLSICVLHPFFHLSSHPSVCPSIQASVFFLFFHGLSVHPSIRLFVCLPVHPFNTFLSIDLSTITS